MVWLRRLLWCVGGVLVLWGVAWLAVPPLLKWQGEKRLSELLGRTVTIGKVDFSPWSLRFAIDEFAVSAAPGAAQGGTQNATAQPPQLSIAAVRVDVDARSLLRLAPVVESLQIDALRVHLTRTADGHYDIDDLLVRLAPKADAEPGEPQRFALYNLEVRDGEFLFDDRPIGRQHRVSGLQLSLPFISNLAADVKVTVEPRLAFSLNGAAFDSGAHALPFSPEHNGALSLRVDAVDLKPYLGYLPAALPVRVTRGSVSANLTVDFSAPTIADARVGIHGSVGVDALGVTEADGAPLLDIEKLSLALNDVRPLARKVALGALKIDGLTAHVARDAQGALSLMRLQAPSAPASGTVASSAAASTPVAPTEAQAGWQVTLEALEVSGSQVVWDDAAVQPPSAFVLADLGLQATRLQLPAKAPMPFRLSAVLRPQSDPGVTLATLALEGQASDAAATVDVDVGALSLAALAPYVSLAPSAHISGTGALRAKVAWAAAVGDQPEKLVATIAELGLDGLKAGVAPAGGRGGKSGGEIVAAQRVRLTDAEIDLPATKISIGAISVKQPQVRLDRSTDGAWNVMQLAGATSLAEDPRADVRAAAGKSWQVALRDLRVDDGRVHLSDAAPAPPAAGSLARVVRLDIDQARIAVQDLRLEGARLVSRPTVAITARIRAPSDDDGQALAGTVDWRGQIGIQPLWVRGTARVENFPVHAVRPYVPQVPGLRLARAQAGFRGDVSVQQSGAAGVNVDVAGDVRLSDLMLLSVPVAQRNVASERGQELLSWQAFDLKGVKLALRPDAKPRLAIRDATLSDFFARLTLTEDGRLNLKDVTDSGAATPAGDAASPPTAVAAAPPSSSAAVAGSTQAPAGGLPVELDLGGLELVAGRVDYSDRFVRPNFSAALTELNGRIGAFRSDSGESADLQLSGRVAGTGLLQIAGKLNPGAVPRELDISANAADLELAPLSPYAGKYAGYAIERGKLSMNVHYKIERDGKLTANHQVILNQLTFGERVESPTATKLPVLFAVSLLKDVNGVIDINLPVSGTLADPEFSVGGIIWKVIVNLFTKIITAPFSLLAGGGQDISVVAFQPGTSMPTADGNAAIDKVAKSLAGRPALKLTVTGEADIDTERDAFQRATLEARLVQEKRREALRASGKAPDPAASAPAAAAVTGEERARLLKTVYKNTDLPEKPRNVIGMQADIPPADMEAMLREDVKVSPEAMRELALQRGLAVRDALATKGLATERIFLGAPKLRDTAGVEAKAEVKVDPKGATSVEVNGDAQAKGAAAVDAKAAAAWTPRVKLDLSTK